MKPFYHLLLGGAGRESLKVNSVLVSFAARFLQISRIDVTTASGEALVDQLLVVVDPELSACKPYLVVIQVPLLSYEGVSLSIAVGALRGAPGIIIHSRHHDRRPIERNGGFWLLYLFLLFLLFLFFHSFLLVL